MHFSWAKIRNVRLLVGQALMFHPQLNVFAGDNGAGKTTLLECLQMLSRGASTRGKPSTLVSHGERIWSVRGGVRHEAAPEIEDSIAVRWADRTTQVTVNGEAASLGELAQRVPVLSMSPQSHRMLEEGPGLRRRYLDWGVFHMEHSFYSAWRRLSRALSQRNAAIRARGRSLDVTAWNSELISAAAVIDPLRARYVAELTPVFREELKALGDDADWALHLHSGWKAGVAYADALEAGLPRDLRQGFTVEGPHRAELQLLRGDRNVRNEISRGQQKLVIAALILAQARLYRDQKSESPALLVDDLGAELSPGSRERFLQRLVAHPGQKFVTVLDSHSVERLETDHWMFHVEQGRASRLN